LEAIVHKMREPEATPQQPRRSDFDSKLEAVQSMQVEPESTPQQSGCPHAERVALDSPTSTRGGMGDNCAANDAQQVCTDLAEPTCAPCVGYVNVPSRAALTWQAVPGSEFYIVEARRVHLPSNSTGSGVEQGFSWGDWEPLESTTKTTLVVTGLELGAVYEFAYRAANSGKQSGLSPPSAAHRTGPRPPGAPGRPWIYGPSATPPYDPVLAFAAPPSHGDGTDAPVQSLPRRCR